MEVSGFFVSLSTVPFVLPGRSTYSGERELFTVSAVFVMNWSKQVMILWANYDRHLLPAQPRCCGL